MKLFIKLFVCLTCFIGTSAQAVIFSSDDTVGNIRQSAGTTLQINLGSTSIANNCSTKSFAVAIDTNHPNFKNMLASVLTAKASGATVQFGVFDNSCINGFAEVDIFTIKDL